MKDAPAKKGHLTGNGPLLWGDPKSRKGKKNHNWGKKAQPATPSAPPLNWSAPCPPSSDTSQT